MSQPNIVNNQTRKTRTVSFRLTPDDYRTFLQACRAYRVRNVSELARTALRNMVAEDGAAESQIAAKIQINGLRQQVRALTADMERLASRLSVHDQALAPASPGASEEFPC